MRLSVLGVGSKNSPKTRKNTPKWVKISIFLPKSPQNPPENGFWGGSGQFSALISGKTSKIVVKFRGGGVLRIDPHTEHRWCGNGIDEAQPELARTSFGGLSKDRSRRQGALL